MKFRKKPVVIDAIQWDGSPDSAANVIWGLGAEESIEYHAHLMDGDLVAHPDPYLLINTLEGRMSASVGDYIIKGVKGEFYPCKPDIFEATYEEVK